MMMARLTVQLLRMQHTPMQDFHTDQHRCQKKSHREKLSQCHKEELSDFPDTDLENANLKTMRNRVVAFSSKIVAQQKKKPGNALFIRLPRLVATTRTQPLYLFPPHSSRIFILFIRQILPNISLFF